MAPINQIIFENSQNTMTVPAKGSIDHLFKHYFKELREEKAAKAAAVVWIYYSISSIYKYSNHPLTQVYTPPPVVEEVVKHPEPAGYFIDEGLLSEFEDYDSDLDYDTSPSYRPRKHQARVNRMRSDYSVTYSPADVPSKQRSVLIQEIPAETTAYSIVSKHVETDTHYTLIPAIIPRFKIKDADGQAIVYGESSALVVFDNADNAKSFVQTYEEGGEGLGTVKLLESAMNPKLGRWDERWRRLLTRKDYLNLRLTEQDWEIGHEVIRLQFLRRSEGFKRGDNIFTWDWRRTSTRESMARWMKLIFIVIWEIWSFFFMDTRDIRVFVKLTISGSYINSLSYRFF